MCFQLRKYFFVLSLQIVFKILCRVQSLEPSAEYFDELFPRHLLNTDQALSNGITILLFLFFLETIKIITFFVVFCQQKTNKNVIGLYVTAVFYLKRRK
ncbi:hypothetical protein D920_01972 [Enterococcus faecalis 13-SD-W-01]|nr:hypothetical protein D920_01972 [Enterococcus faecalis 13-SD-W-01]